MTGSPRSSPVRSFLVIILVMVMLAGALPLIANEAKATTAYSVNIPVNASPDGALTNYAVRLTVFSGSGTNSAGHIYTNGHCTNWPYDIHFTNSIGATVGSWRESFTGTSAIIWVNCTSIPSTGTAAYIMVYGDGGADISNAANVFTFSDMFDSLDPSKWTISGAPSISNGVLVVTGGNDGLLSKRDYNFGYSIYAKVDSQSQTTSGTGCAGWFGWTTGTLKGYKYVWYGGYPSLNAVNFQLSGGTNFAVNPTFPAIYDTERLTSTNCKGVYNGIVAGTVTGTASLQTVSIGADSTPHTGNISVDWLVIRKVTTNEPTWANPGGEASSIWAPTWTSGTPAAVGTVGTTYTYISSINETGVITAPLKPAGATFIGGVLSFTPSSGGSYSFSLRANSTVGTLSAWKNWSVTVPSIWAPTWTSGSPAAVGTVGTTYTYPPTTNESSTITLTTSSGAVLSSGPVWTKLGIVQPNPSIAGTGIMEPSVIYESGAKVLSVGADVSVFKMWYRYATSSLDDVYYSESLDGLHWSNYTSNPVIGNGQFGTGACPYVYKVDSTYYMAVGTNGHRGGDIYTSLDGISWSMASANAFPVGSSTTDWNYALGNPCIWREGVNSWYAFVECRASSDSTWHVGLYTSSNGLSWTPYANNPISVSSNDVGGPQVFKVGTIYYMVFHGCHGSGLPTDIGWAYSTDLIHWAEMANPIITRTQPYEGPGLGQSQIADPHIVEVNGKTYLYYTACVSQTDWRGIALAISNLTLAQILQVDQKSTIKTMEWTPSSVGSYSFSLRASSTVGTLSTYKNWTVTVAAPIVHWAPTFTSSPTTTGSYGTTYSYTATANESASWTMISKPTWATFSGSTFSGSPQAGAWGFSLKATSTAGTLSAYQNWTVTVPAHWAPTWTNTPATTGSIGTMYLFNSAVNESSTITVITLPSGATYINNAVNWTPNAIGTYAFSLRAVSIVGTLASYLNWTAIVSTPIPIWPSPVFVYAPVAEVTVNSPYSFLDLASGLGLTYSLDSDATFLSIGSSTGLITGTATHHAWYYVHVSASNSSSRVAWQNYSLYVNDSLPHILTTGIAPGMIEDLYSYSIVTTGTSISFGLRSNASFLHMDPGSSVVSGTPSLAGHYWALVTASNSAGSVSRNYTLNITDGGPAFVTVPESGAIYGTEYVYDSSAIGNGNSYSIDSNATFLTIDPVIGRISGTPDAVGPFWVNVTVSNSHGHDSQNYSLTVSEAASIPDSGTNGGSTHNGNGASKGGSGVAAAGGSNVMIMALLIVSLLIVVGLFVSRSRAKKERGRKRVWRFRK